MPGTETEQGGGPSRRSHSRLNPAFQIHYLFNEIDSLEDGFTANSESTDCIRDVTKTSPSSTSVSLFIVINFLLFLFLFLPPPVPGALVNLFDKLHMAVVKWAQCYIRVKRLFMV
jgi:hypothetical protein